MTHVLPSLITGLIFLTVLIPNPIVAATLAPVSNALAVTATHVVAPGDTLYSIARRYGTTVDALKAANGLTSDVIRIGQTLHVGSSSPQPSTGTYHTVVRGDTLYSLARRYGTTIDAIMRANHLTSPNIYVGQRLIISSLRVPPVGSTIYTVVGGDTLYSIARRYGTTVDAIQAVNDLSSNYIYVGQPLLIPSTQTPIAPTAVIPTLVIPTATPIGSAIPTNTPTSTTFTPSPTSTIQPTQTPANTIVPTPTHTPSPTLQSTMTPTQIPTQTATPSPTTTSEPTEEERAFVEQAIEIIELDHNAMGFLVVNLTTGVQDPTLLTDVDWVATTAFAAVTIENLNGQIRAFSIPPRYAAAVPDLQTATQLTSDQAIDALLVAIDNRDFPHMTQFVQVLLDARAALHRARAILETQ
jgi:LysM repeat protein